MELEIFKASGHSSGEKIALPKNVFGVKPNKHAIYLAVKAQNANNRQGTASTKTRSMVRGGGKKPWRQKGRGVARAGTIRSPIWVGGGRIFGPHPRSYDMKVPRKVRSLARASVLSGKVQEDKVRVIEDFKLKDSKTKEMFGILRALDLENKKTLLLLSEYDESILRAGRNIPGLKIQVASSVSAYELLNCECLLIQKGAVDRLSGVFKK